MPEIENKVQHHGMSSHIHRSVPFPVPCSFMTMVPDGHETRTFPP